MGHPVLSMFLFPDAISGLLLTLEELTLPGPATPLVPHANSYDSNLMSNPLPPPRAHFSLRGKTKTFLCPLRSPGLWPVSHWPPRCSVPTLTPSLFLHRHISLQDICTSFPPTWNDLSLNLSLAYSFTSFRSLPSITPSWNFPGGPVVETLCFHCRGYEFDP